MENTKFSSLSLPLKIGVIGGYVGIALFLFYLILFIIGFLIGIAGATP